MNINNITVVKQNSEYRALFEGFTKENDVDPNTKKIGVRCYNKITAIFIKILRFITFGKFDIIEDEEYKAPDGKIFYLNKKSLEKWRQRNKDLAKNNHDIVPDIDDIIEARKKVISEAKKKQGKEQNINELNSEINEYKRRIEDLKKQKEKKNAELYSEIDKVQDKIDKYESILKNTTDKDDKNALNTVLDELNMLLADKEKERYNNSKEKEFQIARAEKKLKNVRKDLEKLTEKPKTPKPVETPKAELTPEQKARVENKEKLLKDIGTHTHLKIQVLFDAILKKLDQDIISEWSLNDNNEFTIKLKNRVQIWSRPYENNGKKDPETPNGVNLILGNNENHEIKGKLDPNMISFTDGFETFCIARVDFKLFKYDGEADVRIKHIKYNSSSQQFETLAEGTGRQKVLGKKITRSKTKERSLAASLKSWNTGFIIKKSTEYAEAYLRKQA